LPYLVLTVSTAACRLTLSMSHAATTWQSGWAQKRLGVCRAHHAPADDAEGDAVRGGDARGACPCAAWHESGGARGPEKVAAGECAARRREGRGVGHGVPLLRKGLRRGEAILQSCWKPCGSRILRRGSLAWRDLRAEDCGELGSTPETRAQRDSPSAAGHGGSR